MSFPGRLDDRCLAGRATIHHGSHRGLLGTVDGPGRGRAEVDAIIVPTARPATELREAVWIAEELGCALVALCSQRSSPADVAALTAGRRTELVALDVTDLPAGLIPEFETDGLLARPGNEIFLRLTAVSGYQRHSDLSLKRNLGLLFARYAGWQRVVFLDDDIAVPCPDDLRCAAALLDDYRAVGLAVDGFPDNSVVCHAYRRTGGEQDTFVGGGALAVPPHLTDSFFPNVYNEDWFFLLDDRGLVPTGLVGQVKQRPYDPFDTDHGARGEELGECLAEGLFWLLDRGLSIAEAGLAHWQGFLRRRRAFIELVIGRVDQRRGATAALDDAARERMLTALRAARERNERVTPEFCLDYLAAWRRDRRRWRRHLRKIGAPGGGAASAVAGLGLATTPVPVPVPATRAAVPADPPLVAV